VGAGEDGVAVAETRGPDRSPVVAVRLPLALVTGTAVVFIPAVVWCGFAAVGAAMLGLVPAGIVLSTLWLMHRKIGALARAVGSARDAALSTHTQSAQHRDAVALLEQRAQAHRRELLLAQETTAYALMKLVEARDPSTGVHLERVRAYAKLLASTMARTPHYRGRLDELFVSTIHTASPLHDIGKVGISDMVLLKPAKLTPEETTLMRRHATMGGQTLRAIARRGGDNAYIETAYEVAMYHHERWDGTGYPFALPGPNIPLSARIVALADVYDALTSKRCYKPAWSHAEARAYVIEQAGRHFDPEVVEAFLARELDFVRVRDALTGDLPMQSDDLPELIIDPRLRGAA
jgi:response regulator RpfG family c-di-GMP phosphodiesterase